MSWHFSASLVQGGRPNTPPLACYRRGVFNKSSATILNIRWDVAAFRRRMIPSQKILDSCSTLPGLLSDAPTAGPLYYGISSDTYDTTVLRPHEGWEQRDAQLVPESLAAQTDEFPPMRSVFEFALDEMGAEGTITIYSYVQVEAGPRFRLTYEIENRGPQAVDFVLNVPMTAEMEKLPFSRPTLVKSNSRMFFDSYVKSPITAQSALILVSDVKNKQGFAAEPVGVYAPIDGKRSFSDKQLLESVQ
jgi:hypothetical protein